ncbi:acyl-ACP--UDP-N-acetylglucosamine O-acyltransferase [Sansalvadorimonas sp. 2012CJ34-2]|uniref:Acyl-[acyl-carrier-protein]--UDP-N-acetylglucosamine O-acyltransferase n=1 Tax=Parendozoicomonas callyspongiae TaxID=2942213 RepID=A0ABT0PKT2_9GAMM|nr:acyl-ACP--UDP-N-acetylglucosamine O-acyltransferase [Sansalvadorimonas sp. 2012CJ34-2]MCL6272000.1 acyl-ACP--UDP-N-acetylglucosamine O-acyltransferase [Sansalvadorimonas sp. 2012CJ34-2]
MIDSRAVIHPSARLADDVEVGPFTIIGPDVEIGAGTKIHSHAVIKGPTTIGCNNTIFQFASVGEDCQDKKYRGEPTRLEIGDNNVIREGCTIHRGTVQDNSLTCIGDGNLLMAYAHIAHDCMIGNNIIIANNSAIAGHVVVEDEVILGGFTAVHQFCHIGRNSMTAAQTAVFKDIPAYIMSSGNPATPHGMNFEGMRRRGWSDKTIRSLRRAYKVLYRQGLKLTEALEVLQGMAVETPEINALINSLQSSSRGIIR